MKLKYALLTSAVTLTSFGQAYAIDKISSPNVHKGELEIEYVGSSTFDSDGSKNADQEHELDIEYGLTDRVKLEIEGILEHEPREETIYAATEAGATFQFFEQGENWLDSGVKVMYSHAAHEGEANAIEAKLLLEKESGKFLHRANLGLEHEVGSDAEDGFERSALWSTRYRYNANFAPGFEVQSDFGRAEDHADFNEQKHYAGPAIYGEVTHGLKYEAAYLFGLTDASANGAARVMLEYEIYF